MRALSTCLILLMVAFSGVCGYFGFNAAAAICVIGAAISVLIRLTASPD